MIVRMDEGLRVIRMRWWDAGANSDREIDFAFTEQAWNKIKMHPLLEAFNPGEGMSTVMNAAAGDEVVLPCRGGGAIVFRVGAKM